jgi:peptide/nickel transport system substrate-binding protein
MSYKRGLLAAASLSLLLAGCGGGDSGGGGGGTPASSDAAAGPAIPPIKLLGPSPAYDPNENEALKVVSENIEKLGLKVEFEGVPDFGTLDEIAQKRDYDMLSSGYVGTPVRLEPTELLTPPFSCDTLDGGNYSGYCNEAYQEQLTKATQSSEQSEREAAVDQAQSLLAEDLPMVVMYYPTVSHLHNKETLSNPVMSASSGYFNFATFMNAEPKDGTITIGISEPGESMNPMCYAGGYSQDAEYQTLVFDTLTRIGPDGEVQNWAASEIERTDENTVLVTLRDGMKFHDGSPVTPKDVAFTYDYYKKWEVGHFVNQVARLKSVEPVGRNQVRFNLAESYGAIEFQLFAQVGILPEKVWKDVVKREKLNTPCDWKDPDYTGSGPYKMVSTDPNKSTRLLRNDDHFQPPKAKELIGRYFSTQQSLFLDMRAGNTQLHDSDPGFTPSQIEQVKSDGHLAVERAESITVRYFSYNMREGKPFHDFALRKAVAQAVDYDTIVAGILRNEAVPGKGILAPSNSLWHNAGAEYPAFDLDAAKETLTDAGYTWDDAGALHQPADYKPKEFGSEG